MVVLALAVALVGCRPTVGTEDAEAVSVNLTELLASPSRYRGKRVRVRAYLRNEFEGHSLHVDAASADDPNSGPQATRLAECHRDPTAWMALWWTSAEPIPRSMDKKTVVAEGTFDPCEGGHRGAYAGRLAITYIAQASL
jgi:hypothetical protein